MQMRFLGKTGLKISELSLGTLTFGSGEKASNVGGLGQKEAGILVDLAIDSGINCFDTADVYSLGESEIILGKVLGKRRKDVILATKVRQPVGRGPNDSRLSRHHIIEGCEASLKRLGTDYIDLYQVHAFDETTLLEETLRALDDLVRSGKVRYIGCSNFTGWQLMKALAISDKRGWEKFISLQTAYSLLVREVENELIPVCLDQGLGVLCWSPLAGGFLSGKYHSGKPRPEGARLSNPDSPFAPADEQKGLGIVDSLEKIAVNHGSSIAQTALSYILNRTGISSVIIGARNPQQFTDNIKATDLKLETHEIASLDEVSRPPRLYPYWMQKSGVFDRPV